MKATFLFSLLAGTTAIANASPHPAPPPQTPLNTETEVSSQSTTTKIITSNNDLNDIINTSPLLSLHRDLVQISSVTEDEHNVGEFVSDFLQAHNFTVIKQDVAPAHENGGKDRFNIYAFPAHNTSPKILLTSHIDTVPPFIPYSLSAPKGDSSTSSSFKREEVLISGRGSVDAKASVAAQIFAALETLKADPDTSLGLLFVVGEETGGEGMKHFSESEYNPSPPTFHTVIFGEPPIWHLSPVTREWLDLMSLRPVELLILVTRG